MKRRIAVRSVLGLALLLGIPGAGQQSPFSQLPSRDRTGVSFPDDPGPNSPEKKRIKLLNAERQRALMSDADKLLKLARELNDEVAKTDSEKMTSGQLHKVEEIGKLAKSVKEKMSYSMGGFPSFTAPLTNQPGIQ